jgi:hypothetical protein
VVVVPRLGVEVVAPTAVVLPPPEVLAVVLPPPEVLAVVLPPPEVLAVVLPPPEVLAVEVPLPEEVPVEVPPPEEVAVVEVDGVTGMMLLMIELVHVTVAPPPLPEPLH